MSEVGPLPENFFKLGIALLDAVDTPRQQVTLVAAMLGWILGKYPPERREEVGQALLRIALGGSAEMDG